LSGEVAVALFSLRVNSTMETTVSATCN